MSEYQANVGKRLREIREKYQFTQGDIEDRSQGKIYRQFISRLELSADPRVQLSKVKAMAEILDMEPADLFSYLIGEARKNSSTKEGQPRDLKSFLVLQGDLSPSSIDKVVAFFEFCKAQE